MWTVPLRTIFLRAQNKVLRPKTATKIDNKLHFNFGKYKYKKNIYFFSFGRMAQNIFYRTKWYDKSNPELAVH